MAEHTPGAEVLRDVELLSTLKVGDRVYIGGAGAYTNACASDFNGMELPSPV